ncbi:RlpA-like double-psi beta-barrel-protein domain-containing protein-containing protein [Mycena crocata]|nr:RlpA-like double-psi beta-barrel-protein domain-containing protein-containing protein [Mycena crocata]
MPLSILLLFVLAVSGCDVDALFPNSNSAIIDVLNSTAPLQKRYDQARFTFFQTGLGACGGTNVASDFIVALNSPQYGNGEYCYKMIDITYNGKSAQAQIVDECPGCPWAGLDFSEGLFTHFASEDKGVLYGSWVFSDGSATTTKQTKPTSTPTSTVEKTLTKATSTTASSAPSASDMGNLYNFAQIVLDLSSIIVAGANAD